MFRCAFRLRGLLTFPFRSDLRSMSEPFQKVKESNIKVKESEKVVKWSKVEIQKVKESEKSLPGGGGV